MLLIYPRLSKNWLYFGYKMQTDLLNPSYPLKPYPQEKTFPEESKARQWFNPHATSIISLLLIVGIQVGY